MKVTQRKEGKGRPSRGLKGRPQGREAQGLKALVRALREEHILEKSGEEAEHGTKHGDRMSTC